MLVLSRSKYNEMIANYPEQQDVIATNILSTFGLDTKGQPLAGWTSDGRDDDELFAELRDMVVKAVQNHLDDLQNQFTYAVNMGEVDNVKTLIRKGVDVDTSNYDNSRWRRCLCTPAGGVSASRRAWPDCRPVLSQHDAPRGAERERQGAGDAAGGGRGQGHR